MLERKVPDPPLTRMTGIRVTDVGLGKATMAMPASPWWQTGPGLFAAGSLSFLADGPLGGAVLTAAPAGVGMTTSELSIDFLRPATVRGGMLVGRGRLIHSTRSQGLSEVFIEDSNGRMLAHGTSRCILFPIDPAAGLPELDLDPDGIDLYRLEVEGNVLGQEYWNSRSGQEVLADFIQGTYRSPHTIFAGFSLIEFSEGTCVATMPASPWFSNSSGSLYGGAITFLLDFSSNCACLTTLPAATAFAPLDLKVNFLRPVLPDGSTLSAKATVTHRGRSVAVITSEVVNEDGKKIAVASETILILADRAWERPVYVVDEAPEWAAKLDA